MLPFIKDDPILSIVDGISPIKLLLSRDLEIKY